jgi:hypothetical protein
LDWPKDLQTLFEQGWAANPIDRPTMKELNQQIKKLQLMETFQQHQQRKLHSQSFSSTPFLSSILGRRAEQEEGNTKPKVWVHRTLQVIPRLIRRIVDRGSFTGERSPSFSNTDAMSTFDSFDS